MQILRIESANPIREAPHKLHVVLRVVVDTPEGPVEKSREVPVRKAFYKSLTAAKQLAYATKCHRLHHLEDMAVRAEFDADDKARADADAAAAKATQDAADAAARAEAEALAAAQAKEAYERFTVTPQGFAHDEKGEVAGVRVTITHQGHTCTANIGLVPSLAEENARVAWRASKDAADKMQAALNQFAVVK